VILYDAVGCKNCCFKSAQEHKKVILGDVRITKIQLYFSLFSTSICG